MKRQYKTIKQFRMFSATWINRNFRIKLYGVVDGVKRNTLLGVSGALAILGDYLYKFIERALAHGEDKEVCKLRSGIKVTLYCK